MTPESVTIDDLAGRDALDSDAMKVLRALQASGAGAGLPYSAIVSRVATELRKARGLSQEELARTMGTTQSALSRVEQGDTVFNADHAIAFGLALGVLPHKIFAIADVAVAWLQRQDLQVASTKAEARATILGPGAAALLVGPIVTDAVGLFVSTTAGRSRSTRR